LKGRRKRSIQKGRRMQDCFTKEEESCRLKSKDIVIGEEEQKEVKTKYGGHRIKEFGE